MRRAGGKLNGEVLRPLRYANTWIAALDPEGEVVYVEADKVRLNEPDLSHFTDRDTQRVGGFWSEWTLDEEELVFRRQRAEQQPRVLCPHCGVRQNVTEKGRLQLHLSRDLPQDGAKDRRCVGSALLVRVDVVDVAEAVPRRDRRRREREARRSAEGNGESEKALNLTDLDKASPGNAGV